MFGAIAQANIMGIVELYKKVQELEGSVVRNHHHLKKEVGRLVGWSVVAGVFLQLCGMDEDVVFLYYT